MNGVSQPSFEIAWGILQKLDSNLPPPGDIPESAQKTLLILARRVAKLTSQVEAAECYHCNCVTLNPTSDICTCGNELYPVSRIVPLGVATDRLTFGPMKKKSEPCATGETPPKF
jgi:hypothetical protein